MSTTLAVLVVLWSPAPGSPQPELEGKAGQILAEHIERRGGLERLHNLERVRKTGRFSSLGLEWPVSELVTREGVLRLRVSSEYGESLFELAGDRVSGRSIFPTWATEHWPVRPFDADFLRTQSALLGTLVEAVAKGRTVRLIDPSEGEDPIHFQVVLEDGSERSVFLDAETLQVRSYAYESRLGKLPGRVLVELADYREVDGVQIHHRVVAYFGGFPLYELQYDEVEINPNLGDRREPLKSPASSAEVACKMKKYVNRDLGFSTEYCSDMLEGDRRDDSLLSLESPDYLPHFEVVALGSGTAGADQLKRQAERLLKGVGGGEARVTSIEETVLEDGETPAIELFADWTFHGLPLRTYMLTTAKGDRDIQVRVTDRSEISGTAMTMARSLRMMKGLAGSP